MEINEIEKYGCILAWSKELGISQSTLAKRLKDIQGVTAKNINGRLLRDGYFAGSDVRSACADLLIVAPKADTDGFFTHEGERYGHFKAWAQEFGLSPTTVQKKLRSAQGMTGKYCTGEVAQNAFFSEATVRLACADLIQDIPQADTAGFFMQQDGVSQRKYGTVRSWARALGISDPSVRERMNGIKGITAKDSSGQVIHKGFFSEEAIRVACKDLLLDVPQADEEGFFLRERNGNKERYGHITAWSRALKVSSGSLRSRLKNAVALTGKDSGGRVREKSFYAESDVMLSLEQIPMNEIYRNRREEDKIDPELHQFFPKADATGFFKKEGERYATRHKWSKAIGLSEPTVKQKLRSQKGISGIDAMGHFQKGGFYAESAVQTACADLLRDTPCADDSGFIRIDDERYATVGTWSREFGIGNRTVQRRLKNITGITGKDVGGRIWENGYYAESEVRRACSDALSDDLPRADASGFAVVQKDGSSERYANLSAWGRFHGISPSTIKTRLNGMQGITGKLYDNQVVINGFFAESDVDIACQDLISRKAKAE